MTESAAEAHLRSIRQLMERATIYRAISAPTALVGGLLSLGTAGGQLAAIWLDHGERPEAIDFFATWVLVLITTAAANAFFLWNGARQRGESMFSPAMKLALRSVFPSSLAGGVVSFCVALSSGLPILPVLFWMIFYGLALLATMNFAPRSIVLLGWAFLATGVAAFAYLVNETLVPDLGLPMPSSIWPSALMGATFGGFHLIYAACTWPRQSHLPKEIRSLVLSE